MKKYNTILIYFIQNARFYENFSFLKKRKAVYICFAFAKSNAGRGNPFYLIMASKNTPLACFFVRGLHTSKERLKMACSSMMACSGQGVALDCFPLLAVFPPRYTLSPYIVENVEDSPQNLIMELSAMIYQFLITSGEKRLKISISANTEQEARERVKFTSQAVLIKRLNRAFYCPSSFPKSSNHSSSGSSTPLQGAIYA